MRGEVFKKAVGDYEYFVSDSDLISEYEKREMFLNGQAAALDYERYEARQEGLKEGIEQGVQEKALEMARAMKNDGIDTVTIEKYTGLSEQEIKAIKN